MRCHRALATCVSLAILALAACGGDSDDSARPALGEFQGELDAAAADAGFDVKAPAFLPTAANSLAFVDVTTPPAINDGGPARVQLVFRGDDAVDLGDRECPSTLVAFQTNQPVDPGGAEPTGDEPGGYALYEELAGENDAGEVVQSVYTAISDDESFVFQFIGDHPTRDEVVQMIESLTVVASP